MGRLDKTTNIDKPKKETKPKINPSEYGVNETKTKQNYVAATLKNENDKTENKKVGRPKSKTEKCKNINIAIPLSVLDKMEIAKECYSKNMTLYINTLIEKDLEQNFEKYQTLCEQLKQLNIV